jgi:hypothetical protein
MTPWLRRRLLALLRLRRSSREFDLSSAADPIDPDSVPTPVVGDPPPLESAVPTRNGWSSRPPPRRKRGPR